MDLQVILENTQQVMCYSPKAAVVEVEETHLLMVVTVDLVVVDQDTDKILFLHKVQVGQDKQVQNLVIQEHMDLETMVV